jgi:hypothetical protein
MAEGDRATCPAKRSEDRSEGTPVTAEKETVAGACSCSARTVTATNGLDFWGFLVAWPVLSPSQALLGAALRCGTSTTQRGHFVAALEAALDRVRPMWSYTDQHNTQERHLGFPMWNTDAIGFGPHRSAIPSRIIPTSSVSA